MAPETNSRRLSHDVRFVRPWPGTGHDYKRTQQSQNEHANEVKKSVYERNYFVFGVLSSFFHCASWLTLGLQMLYSSQVKIYYVTLPLFLSFFTNRYHLYCNSSTNIIQNTAKNSLKEIISEVTLIEHCLTVGCAGFLFYATTVSLQALCNTMGSLSPLLSIYLGVSTTTPLNKSGLNTEFLVCCAVFIGLQLLSINRGVYFSWQCWSKVESLANSNAEREINLYTNLAAAGYFFGLAVKYQENPFLLWNYILFYLPALCTALSILFWFPMICLMFQSDEWLQIFFGVLFGFSHLASVAIVILRNFYGTAFRWTIAFIALQFVLTLAIFLDAVHISMNLALEVFESRKQNANAKANA